MYTCYMYIYSAWICVRYRGTWRGGFHTLLLSSPLPTSVMKPKTALLFSLSAEQMWGACRVTAVIVGAPSLPGVGRSIIRPRKVVSRGLPWDGRIWGTQGGPTGLGHVGRLTVRGGVHHEIQRTSKSLCGADSWKSIPEKEENV